MKRFKNAFMSALAMGAAFCCGSLFAEENKYIGANNGSWFDDANWSLNRAPEASDDVVVESRTVVATDTAGLTATDQPIKVNSLTLNGANLTIGDENPVARSMARRHKQDCLNFLDSQHLYMLCLLY